MKKKTGVYVCHCGGNISNVVDVKKVAESVKNMENVVISKDYPHMCSEVGQQMIIIDAKENDLDRIVVAACSPQFQGKTFCDTMSKGGLNPYLMEMANIREHCSWSHADNPEQATKKAESLTKMAISKVSHSQPLEKGCIKTEKRVLIIGGGIAGIQSSLDLADSGYEVTLVEKSPSIGGVMAQLSRTFPTDDCSTCILSPKMAEVNENPNINLMTYSEITDISGSLGNFKIKIKKKTRYIDEEKCVSCGICTEKCPVTIEDNFNCNMSNTKAIRLPFSYAAPLQYYIEKDSCLRLTKGGEVCGICQTVCPKDAIDFNLKDEIIELTVDSVIVATGFDIFDATKKPEYNFGRSSNIIDGLQVERFIVNKVEGTLLREMGNKIAFIQCIGSRDEQIGREYCSRVCCMYAIKQAKILKTMNPAADVYIFYIDIRAFGKGYEEYYTQAQNVGVKFVRGKVAALREDEETGKVIVRAEDTLNREIIEGEFDTVVLSVGMGPNKGTESVAEMLKLSKTPDGFLQEAHPKFKPVDTMVPGVFLAGTVQGPKDIPDTVNQASAAAARAIGLLNKGKYYFDPLYAIVHEELCTKCGKCDSVCPYGAISMNKDGIPVISKTTCTGCGICLETCPTGALDLTMYSNKQLISEANIAGQDKDGSPRIVIFADDMTSYRMIDTVGISKLQYSTNTRVIRVHSAGRITPEIILETFIAGADYILIADAEEKSSPFPYSKKTTIKFMEKARKIMDKYGIESSRINAIEFVTIMLPKFLKTVSDIETYLQKNGLISEELRKTLKENLESELWG